jgi:cytochrome b
MHLGLVLLLPILLLSVHVDEVPVAVHLWSGYLLLALLLLRLVWGLAGSDSARFARFLGGPAAVGAYLPRLISRRPTRWPGHNPIGALYVIVILVLLLAASVSGLFYENWGDWRGPLAERVDRSTALWLSDLHGLLQWPILTLVSIHIAVVLGYRLLKDEDRIGPMFGSGRIRLESDPRLSFAPRRRALLLAVSAALAIALLLRFGPIA